MRPVEFVAPVGSEEHDAARREAAGYVLEQFACGPVRPVDVVDDDEQRLRPRPELEQRYDGFEQTHLGLGRVAAGRGGRQSVAELGEDLAELSGHRAELGAHGGDVLLVEAVADRLDERQVGERKLGFGAAAPQHPAAELAGAPLELVRQPGLADAGFAAE